MMETNEFAIASTICVPEKIPANIPAANTNVTTVIAFPACDSNTLFLLFQIRIVNH